MTEEDTETPEPEDTDEPTMGKSAEAQLRNSIRKLEKIQEQTNNPEVGEQIMETVEVQERSQERIEAKLSEMDARPGFLKFILGPDYKNAGEVRSTIVKLQNEVRQMTRIRERLSNPEDISTLEEAIEEAQSSIDGYKELLSEKLSGFSLFGWLVKFLQGYTPEPSASPEPSLIPSPSPNGSTPSPIASPETTESPEPTVEPTATP